MEQEIPDFATNIDPSYQAQMLIDLAQHYSEAMKKVQRNLSAVSKENFDDLRTLVSMAKNPNTSHAELVAAVLEINSTANSVLCVQATYHSMMVIAQLGLLGVNTIHTARMDIEESTPEQVVTETQETMARFLATRRDVADLLEASATQLCSIEEQLRSALHTISPEMAGEFQQAIVQSVTNSSRVLETIDDNETGKSSLH